MILLLPTPLWPTRTRLSWRPMKAAVANSSIWVRLIALALKSQSKSASVYESRKQASLMRRAMARSRRCWACSAMSACTNSRCDRPPRSARARRASSWSPVNGTLSAAKSASRRSRRSGRFVRVWAAFVVGSGLGGFFRLVGLAMIVRLLTELLIFGGAAWRHGFVQQRFQVTTFVVGQGLQNTFGLGLGRQDAFDRLRRIGAEADGAVERGEQVFAGVGAQQGKHPSRLILAAALIAEQPVEEAAGRRAQFGEAFAQERQMFGGVVAWPMGSVHTLLLGDTAREQTMPGDLGDGRTVDDDFCCGDAQRQRLADETPGNRVIVLLIADGALDIGDAVQDQGRVIGLCGQGNQVRLLQGVAFAGSLLGLAMDLDVGHLGQPPGSDLVEVGQTAKSPAVEQVLLDEVETSFHLSLRLGTARQTGPRFEAVVRGKGQEARVVQRAV